MNQVVTEPELRKLRKYESILVISGYGVIVFTLWSVIRAGIYYFLNPLDITAIIGEAELAEFMAAGREAGVGYITDNIDKIMMALLFIELMIDVLLRLYIGMTARAYGRGRKKSGLFVILAWITAVLLVSSILITVDDFIQPIISAFNNSPETAFKETGASGDQAASVSILVDITSLLILVELAVSGMKVRKQRKKLGVMQHEYGIDDFYDDMAELSEGISSIKGE